MSDRAYLPGLLQVGGSIFLPTRGEEIFDIEQPHSLHLVQERKAAEL
jgi:hypothetical protein